MMFASELAEWLKTTAPLPSEDLKQQFAANRALLDSGWEHVWKGTLPMPPPANVS